VTVLALVANKGGTLALGTDATSFVEALPRRFASIQPIRVDGVAPGEWAS
jgi:hypothetical protein